LRPTFTRNGPKQTRASTGSLQKLKYGYAIQKPSIPIDGFDADRIHCEADAGVRTCCSIHAGHGADNRSVRLDACIGRGCGTEMCAVCLLRAAASACACRLANVPRQYLNEFCRPSCRCDDRKCPQFLAHRSPTSLRSLLATNPQARQGGSAALVGPRITCGARWGDDWSDGGELHSVHGRPRGT